MDEDVFEQLDEMESTFRARKVPVEVDVHGPLQSNVEIHTREGTVVGEPGDYIIRGVAGEVYPIDADIFENTYERIEDAN